ncbi:hypothetical protein WN51_07419 [Melipona quadrifasciata]|uniref:Uncharacterized protein n=1 Tax=Melipona quadrifasciata TaxID=166423 RepID=A0A0N0BCB0_9HYME|nr:hypothetical protein WN51_07419 [Melipona quadrifasciata]
MQRMHGKDLSIFIIHLSYIQHIHSAELIFFEHLITYEFLTSKLIISSILDHSGRQKKFINSSLPEYTSIKLVN